jgi:Site-specific recombinase XerD
MARQSDLPFRLYKRGKFWHARFSFKTNDGERLQFRESTGTIEKDEATVYAIRRIANYRRIEENGEMTVEEAFSRFFTEIGCNHSKPEITLQRMRVISDFFGRKTMLPKITKDDVQSFIITKKRTVSNSTINRYLTLFATVLNRARDVWEIRTPNLKISKFKQKEPAESIKYLKDWDTAQRIIDNASFHLKPIIYTALYTGLRLGNILNLKWENIDFVNKSLSVKVKDRGKEGGKNHTLPLIKPLEDVLNGIERASPFVFTYKGKPIKSIKRSWENSFYVLEETGKRNGRGQMIKKKVNLKGIDYINFHALRHTAATWILRKTNNLKVTKEILGHADIKTTLRYAHVLDEEKRNALSSVFNDTKFAQK